MASRTPISNKPIFSMSNPAKVSTSKLSITFFTDMLPDATTPTVKFMVAKLFSILSIT